MLRALRSVGRLAARAISSRKPVRARSRVVSPALARAFGAEAAPAQEEKFVNVTFITHAGERSTVKGRVGDTLLQVAWDNDILMLGSCRGGDGDPDDYCTGPACIDCRVQVAPDYMSIVGERNWKETEVLSFESWDMTDNTRMACQFTLTEEMDGMFLAMPMYTDHNTMADVVCNPYYSDMLDPRREQMEIDQRKAALQRPNLENLLKT